MLLGVLIFPDLFPFGLIDCIRIESQTKEGQQNYKILQLTTRHLSLEKSCLELYPLVINIVLEKTNLAQGKIPKVMG